MVTKHTSGFSEWGDWYNLRSLSISSAFPSHFHYSSQLHSLVNLSLDIHSTQPHPSAHHTSTEFCSSVLMPFQVTQYNTISIPHLTHFHSSYSWFMPVQQCLGFKMSGSLDYLTLLYPWLVFSVCLNLSSLYFDQLIFQTPSCLRH